MDTKNVPNQSFRIKMLANDSVILVEADKYESEIFMPQIVNGRIAFVNIIPYRRCCQISQKNVLHFAPTGTKSNATCGKESKLLITNKLGRWSSGDATTPVARAPLANSTPVDENKKPSSAKNNLRSIISSCPKEDFSNPYFAMPEPKIKVFKSSSRTLETLSPQSATLNRQSTDDSLPSPEPLRRAAKYSPRMLEKSMLNLHNAKISRLYTNSADGTPKKVGRLVLCNRNRSSQNNSANSSILNGSFQLCSSPLRSNNSKSTASAAASIAKWQKVLTPIRTYSRKNKKQAPPIGVGREQKNYKMNKVLPNFMMNPTQCPDVSLQIEIKKRKLIMDKKCCISPKTFKRQQQEPVETFRKPANASEFSLKKPFVNRQSGGMSAFDMLTNSNRHRTMAEQLNNQFRKGCVNKASSTYDKYKVLCKVPELQQDNQVLELSQNHCT